MSGNLIGFVTIGQSPRNDIIPWVKDNLPQKSTVVEAGALDDLGKNEIDALAPDSNDYPLYTRLANGQSVTVAKRLIIPRIQSCIDQLNTNGADVIALLCSGSFPNFQSRAPLLLPNQIVDHVIQSSLDLQRRIAVLLPLASQIEPIHQQFGNNEHLLLFALGPTANNTEVDQLVLGLQHQRVDLTLLRCFSYSLAMKDAIATRTSTHTLLARSLLVENLVQTVKTLRKAASN